ncbi:MAG TPA: amidase family protein, partial [Lautropia sp.]|nr:amidase family protein [Lautropia sp.]
MTESLRPISTLTAVEIREHLASGHERVEAFSARLAEVVAAADEPIRAFAHLDPRVIALQANRLEKQWSAGELPGPLFGVPVGVKDIIDTAEYPTEYGSPIHAGRHAGTDAPVVARLRAAGAIVFGKTVTTEFATFQPSITRNPHDLDHT